MYLSGKKLKKCRTHFLKTICHFILFFSFLYQQNIQKRMVHIRRWLVHITHTHMTCGKNLLKKKLYLTEMLNRMLRTAFFFKGLGKASKFCNCFKNTIKNKSTKNNRAQVYHNTPQDGNCQLELCPLAMFPPAANDISCSKYAQTTGIIHK